jgi:hypothetical protein
MHGAILSERPGVLKIPNRKFFKEFSVLRARIHTRRFNLSWRNQARLLNKLLPAIRNFPFFAEHP